MTGESTFGNLHEVLRSLYDEMMPLCSDITGRGHRGGGIGRIVLRGLAGVAGALTRRADRRVSAVPPVLHRGVHHVLPHLRVGTINGIMSPIVTGCHGILQGQTLDMEEYARNGRNWNTRHWCGTRKRPIWSATRNTSGRLRTWLDASELKTMAGMAIERGKYEIKQTISNAFRSFWSCSFRRWADTGHAEDVLPYRAFHPGAAGIRHLGV